MFHSKIFNGEDALEDVWWHRLKMLYQNIGDVYFMQRRTELMVAGYEILEYFAD